MAGSLAVHALLLAGLLLLPTGGGQQQQIPIYTVRIVEAPQIPEARVLDLSPALQRELRLEAPSLALEPPPLPATPAPDITGWESSAAPGPPLMLPPALESPGRSPPRAGVAPPPPAPGELVLPAPPRLPQPPSQQAPPRRPGAPPAPAETPGPTRATPSLPEPPSAEERLRAKVRSLELHVESAETPAMARTPVGEKREKSLVNLRLFQNTVRERVKQNYTFPGAFPEHLRARVKVVLDRQGRLLSADLVQDSGDERFDALVCLNAIRNAKYPPLPDGIEGETHTLFLTCSP
jgi:hypothetical protein